MSAYYRVFLLDQLYLLANIENTFTSFIIFIYFCFLSKLNLVQLLQFVNTYVLAARCG